MIFGGNDLKSWSERSGIEIGGGRFIEKNNQVCASMIKKTHPTLNNNVPIKYLKFIFSEDIASHKNEIHPAVNKYTPIA